MNLLQFGIGKELDYPHIFNDQIDIKYEKLSVCIGKVNNKKYIIITMF